LQKTSINIRETYKPETAISAQFFHRPEITVCG